MTSDWLFRNLSALSLHVGVSALMLAVCLALFRVRAPQTRLRLLEFWLVTACTLTPIASLAGDWRSPARQAPPARLAERIEAATTSRSVAGAAAVPWTDLFVAIWIAGAVLRAGWLVVGYRRLRHRTTVTPPETVDQEVEELRTLLSATGRFRPRCGVRESSGAGT